VFRALTQSADENARIGALPEASDERQLQFTPIVKRAVDQARDHLQSLLGDRVASRADLRRQVDLKDQQVSDAVAVIGAVRNHLYANLPLRKKDPDLHDYGFRPVRTGYSSTQEEIDVEVAQDQ